MPRWARWLPLASPAGGITYSDSPTGAIIFGGSLAEAKIGANAVTGAIIFGGSVVEARIGANAVTGAIIFGGSLVEAHSNVDTMTGAIIFGGSLLEHRILGGVLPVLLVDHLIFRQH